MYSAVNQVKKGIEQKFKDLSVEKNYILNKSYKSIMSHDKIIYIKFKIIVFNIFLTNHNYPMKKLINYQNNLKIIKIIKLS